MDAGLTEPVLWAHPIAVLAIPAFVPVGAIVVTILWIARKDRLAEAAESAEPAAEAALATQGRAAAAVQAPAAEEPREPRRSWRDRMPRLVIGDED